MKMLYCDGCGRYLFEAIAGTDLQRSPWRSEEFDFCSRECWLKHIKATIAATENGLAPQEQPWAT